MPYENTAAAGPSLTAMRTYQTPASKTAMSSVPLPSKSQDSVVACGPPYQTWRSARPASALLRSSHHRSLGAVSRWPTTRARMSPIFE